MLPPDYTITIHMPIFHYQQGLTDIDTNLLIKIPVFQQGVAEGQAKDTVTPAANMVAYYLPQNSNFELYQPPIVWNFYQISRFYD